MYSFQNDGTFKTIVVRVVSVGQTTACEVLVFNEVCVGSKSTHRTSHDAGACALQWFVGSNQVKQFTVVRLQCLVESEVAELVPLTYVVRLSQLVHLAKTMHVQVSDGLCVLQLREQVLVVLVQLLQLRVSWWHPTFLFWNGV